MKKQDAKNHKYAPLTAAMRKELARRAGIVADKQLAKELNIAPKTVYRYRLENGIPKKLRGPDLTAQEKRIARKARTKTELRKAGISVASATRYRESLGLAWPESQTVVVPIEQVVPKKIRKLLGVVPDWTIARLHGHNKSTIGRWRRELGIPAVPRRDTGGRPPISKAPHLYIPTGVRPLLGKKRDQDLAQESGELPSAVARWRRSLGIPAFRAAA